MKSFWLDIRSSHRFTLQCPAAYSPSQCHPPLYSFSETPSASGLRVQCLEAHVVVPANHALSISRYMRLLLFDARTRQAGTINFRRESSHMASGCQLPITTTVTVIDRHALDSVITLDEPISQVYSYLLQKQLTTLTLCEKPCMSTTSGDDTDSPHQQLTRYYKIPQWTLSRRLLEQTERVLAYLASILILAAVVPLHSVLLIVLAKLPHLLAGFHALQGQGVEVGDCMTSLIATLDFSSFPN